ncbi:MAG: hypothetical protein FJ096_11555 [Deltaproteobacteria bacterium]|nr:hypothetical protein [Deltaproteobacteria bacterium]
MRARTWTARFLLAAITIESGALAHDSGRPIAGTLSGLPPGPVKRQLLDLQERARATVSDPAPVDAPIRTAVRALERARQARLAEDERHARMLDQVGAEWARIAERLLEALVAERAALEAERRASELSARQVRARTLLEENQARLGRLEARWSKVKDQPVKSERARDDQAAEVEGKTPPRRPRPKAPRKPPTSRVVKP